MSIIILTLIVSFVLAMLLGFLLGFFRKIFHVEVNPLISQIRDALPGTNCGGCGYPGCDGYAAAIATEDVAANLCTVGGAASASAIGKIIGQDVSSEDQVSVLACQGTCELAPVKGVYNGIQSCHAAKLSIGGLKFCDWGCMGLGDCVKVCPFDAIHIQKDCLPHVDYDKCTGCGLCIKECPQKILLKVPVKRKGAIALCSNRNPVKSAVNKACKVGCIKCGKCERTCPEKAIIMVHGIPQIDYKLCNSCGTCISGCPTKVLKLLDSDVFAR